MARVMAYFFSWPNGAVWGNLIASVIWAAPTAIHFRRKLRKHADLQAQKHEEILRQLPSKKRAG